jgi:hypothetical protein
VLPEVDTKKKKKKKESGGDFFFFFFCCFCCVLTVAIFQIDIDQSMLQQWLKHLLAHTNSHMQQSEAVQVLHKAKKKKSTKKKKKKKKKANQPARLTLIFGLSNGSHNNKAVSSSLPLRTAMSSLRAYESASECSADISAAAPGALEAPIGAPLPLYSAVDDDAAADDMPPPLSGAIISDDCDGIMSGCVAAPDMPIIEPGPDSGSMPRGA